MELSDEQKKLFASYRLGDTQYRLAGEEAGCFKLANDFYDLMEEMQETKTYSCPAPQRFNRITR